MYCCFLRFYYYFSFSLYKRTPFINLRTYETRACVCVCVGGIRLQQRKVETGPILITGARTNHWDFPRRPFFCFFLFICLFIFLICNLNRRWRTYDIWTNLCPIDIISVKSISSISQSPPPPPLLWPTAT